MYSLVFLADHLMQRKQPGIQAPPLERLKKFIAGLCVVCSRCSSRIQAPKLLTTTNPQLASSSAAAPLLIAFGRNSNIAEPAVAPLEVS